jgi:hypothetical protein
MTPTYAYLDEAGWVRQWSLERRPVTLEDGSLGPYLATPVEGLNLDLLPEGFEAKQHLRKVNGVYTDMAAAAGPRPNEYAELIQSGDALTWTVSTPLADLKTSKNAEINAARMTANMTSFSYGGKAIACDALSRSDIDGINGYVTLNGVLPPGWGGAWKAIDNTYVAISTVDDWKAFYASMVGQGQTNFSHAQDLKAQLAAATTPDQVAVITW